MKIINAKIRKKNIGLLGIRYEILLVVKANGFFFEVRIDRSKLNDINSKFVENVINKVKHNSDYTFDNRKDANKVLAAIKKVIMINNFFEKVGMIY